MKYFVLLLICGALLACESNTQKTQSSPEVINIGLIVSLSGPAAEMGSSWLSGAQLAAHELSEKNIDVQLVIDDDQTIPARAVSAFQKQVRVSRVSGIIGGTWDFLGESLYPLADRARVPILTPSNPVELLTEQAQESPWVFSNGMTIAAEEQALEDYLEKQKFETAVLFYPQLPWGVSHAEMFRRLAAKFSIRIDRDIAFPYESYLESTRQAVLEMADSKPDLVYAPIDASGIDILTREFVRLKIDPYLVVSQHLHTAIELTGGGQRFHKVIGIYPRIEDSGFQERYRKFHGKQPQVYAEFGYDALHFLVKSIRAGIQFDDPEQDFVYRGITGVHRLPAPAGKLASNSARLVIWQEKQRQLQPLSD